MYFALPWKIINANFKMLMRTFSNFSRDSCIVMGQYRSLDGRSDTQTVFKSMNRKITKNIWKERIEKNTGCIEEAYPARIPYVVWMSSNGNLILSERTANVFHVLKHFFTIKNNLAEQARKASRYAITKLPSMFLVSLDWPST